MSNFNSRKSWDTAVKHLARHNVLHDILTPQQIASIPRSNISRWKGESDDKYAFCEINTIVEEEIELIKRINQSSNIKKINESYFKLCDIFHAIVSKVKGVKSLIKNSKELVVNTIDSVKDNIQINDALKIFNISRTTFENSNQLYKILEQSVSEYNKIRPQMSLGGNTPVEIFNGISIDFSKYSKDFNEHKAYRRQQNKKNACKMCL